ncbi:MAG: hypothetical protein SH868_05065 [Bythopirellula sp.]|nr:hypothetical protein [Bythopirellula sp.]
MVLALSGALRAQEAGVQFAPGVLTTIPPQLDPADTVSVHDVVEIRAQKDLQWTPKLLSKTRTLLEKAKDAEFRRDIWCLEFSFKPLRMLAVDIPQSTGKMQRKLVWYMVYRVRNTGAGLAPKKKDDDTYTTIEQSMGPQRFVPQFMLTSLDRDRRGEPVRKSYMDRIMPTAVAAIARRELPKGELLNNVQISDKLLEPETGRAVGGLWGVATWEDIDPEMDFFAIYVSGLTNAYQWDDPADFQAGAAPGTGRTFTRKVLQLNFWRPGDSYKENETEIRYGSAPGMAGLYGSREGIAYQWVYR